MLKIQINIEGYNLNRLKQSEVSTATNTGFSCLQYYTNIKVHFIFCDLTIHD